MKTFNSRILLNGVLIPKLLNKPFASCSFTSLDFLNPHFFTLHAISLHVLL